MKFLPLSTNRRVLSWLCVYPTDATASKWLKLAHIIIGVILFAGPAIVTVGSFFWIMKFISIDLEIALFGLLEFVAFVNVVYSHMMAFYYRREIFEMLQDLSKIYEECKFLTELSYFRANYFRTHFSFQIRIKIMF